MKTTNCIKCGETNLRTSYNQEKDILARMCMTCEYSWEEQTLDKEETFVPSTKIVKE